MSFVLFSRPGALRFDASSAELFPRAFMAPRRFFYPRVGIEFYHTMTSRCEPHLTALHRRPTWDT